jgi:hypothetical protein
MYLSAILMLQAYIYKICVCLFIYFLRLPLLLHKVYMCMLMFLATASVCRYKGYKPRSYNRSMIAAYSLYLILPVIQ